MIYLPKDLSRDYKNNPLKYGELINEQDLHYLYLELNLSINEVAEVLGVSCGKVKISVKHYHMNKSRELITACTKRINKEKYGVEIPSKLNEIKEKTKRTCLEKYGVDNPSKLAITQEKIRKTNLEKYGNKCYLSSKEGKEKTKNTCLNKYGVENYTQSKDFREKSKMTCLDRYGVENPMQNKEIQERAEETCLKNYGVPNAAMSERVKQKIKNTNIEKYGAKTFCESKYYDREKEMKKRHQTNIEKFGVNHPMQLDMYKESRRKTCLEKYGVDNTTKLEEIRNKIHDTTKQNDSFAKSKDEEYIYSRLKERYKKVERQYKSKVYPFACDFYIPELDLYIEYQGYQGHGGEPYDENNEKHRLKLEEWKQKSKELVTPLGKSHVQYKKYIELWTIKDPLKREIVKKNNLNWKEFFNLKQFNDWYKITK